MLEARKISIQVDAIEIGGWQFAWAESYSPRIKGCAHFFAYTNYGSGIDSFPVCDKGAYYPNFKPKELDDINRPLCRTCFRIFLLGLNDVLFHIDNFDTIAPTYKPNISAKHIDEVKRYIEAEALNHKIMVLENRCFKLERKCKDMEDALKSPISMYKQHSNIEVD